jgi:hypothetical protein
MDFSRWCPKCGRHERAIATSDEAVCRALHASARCRGLDLLAHEFAVSVPLDRLPLDGRAASVEREDSPTGTQIEEQSQGRESD